MLPSMTFAYILSLHETAGFSPFYLLLGRRPTLPFDKLLPSLMNTLTESAQDVFAQAHTAPQIAGSQLTESQAAQKIRHDNRHQDVRFPPGSIVLLWTPCRHVGLSEKLLPRHTGPYMILCQLGDVNYKIGPLDSRVPTDAVHVSRLKAYFAESSPPL